MFHCIQKTIFPQWLSGSFMFPEQLHLRFRCVDTKKVSQWPPVSPLDHMVGKARCNRSDYSCHAFFGSYRFSVSIVQYGVPRIRDVRLENSQGKVITQRENARDYFTFGRRLFYWDDMDMAYFANYAFWNYFTFPVLLMNEEIVWEEKSPEIIQATFPDRIPTHSRVQFFHFNAENGLLFQHDYTADIISKHAKAANVILKYDERDCLLFPSLRRVTPRTRKGHPLTRPVLIEIKVHDIKLINTSNANAST